MEVHHSNTNCSLAWRSNALTRGKNGIQKSSHKSACCQQLTTNQCVASVGLTKMHGTTASVVVNLAMLYQWQLTLFLPQATMFISYFTDCRTMKVLQFHYHCICWKTDHYETHFDSTSRQLKRLRMNSCASHCSPVLYCDINPVSQKQNHTILLQSSEIHWSMHFLMHLLNRHAVASNEAGIQNCKTKHCEQV